MSNEMNLENNIFYLIKFRLKLKQCIIFYFNCVYYFFVIIFVSYFLDFTLANSLFIFI